MPNPHPARLGGRLVRLAEDHSLWPRRGFLEHCGKGISFYTIAQISLKQVFIRKFSKVGQLRNYFQNMYIKYNL